MSTKLGHIQIKFNLDEEFGLEPLKMDGILVLGFDAKAEKSPKLAAALKAQKKILDSEEAGEITPEELSK
jgi:hypothetical protein